MRPFIITGLLTVHGIIDPSVPINSIIATHGDFEQVGSTMQDAKTMLVISSHDIGYDNI